MFANTQMGGLNLGFPDVCKTPPTAIPAPFPNMGVGPMGVPFVPHILFMATPAHNLLTTIPMSWGDEPGAMMGLISQTFKTSNRSVTGAFTVLLMGMPAQRLTSVNIQNLINSPGVRIVPSQIKVLLLAP